MCAGIGKWVVNTLDVALADKTGVWGLGEYWVINPCCPGNGLRYRTETVLFLDNLRNCWRRLCKFDPNWKYSNVQVLEKMGKILNFKDQKAISMY